MSKSFATKPKTVPWIPPGTSICKDKKPTKPKPTTKYKKYDPVSPKTSPKKILDIPKEDTSKEPEPDVISLSSHSSYATQNDQDIHLITVFQEMKLLYVHFESLKTSYLSAHRLISPQEVDDSSINELFIEAGVCVKELNNSFDDLEYSVSVLENTLNENQKIQEYSKVSENKQKLLSKLLDMYEKVIIIFQSVFEKQDFKEMAHQQDFLNNKLKGTEKKCISQEAVIKDLERRLSIHQSKANALEGNKTYLESAKAELEKQLLHKESKIKYLSNELMKASEKQTNSDHEELIEIIQEMKSKAHTDKSALKKALKFQKTQLQKQEEKCEKLMQELNEKEKMIFDIASQRDQLKVQLTIVNNNIIQQKNQIEEMKIQNLKLQNEMTEKDISHKKAVSELQNNLEEKSSELDKLVKTKAKLEKTIEELEDELQQTKDHLKNIKKEKESETFADAHKSKHRDDMHEEMQRLVLLLQNTKEVFESLKQSSHVISAAGDHGTNDAEFGSVQKEILAAVKETKEHLLQLKNMYKAYIQEQKELPGMKNQPKNNELAKELKKMEQLYNSAMKENVELKQEVEELKNSSIASTTVQKTENYFTTLPNDNFTKKLQLELIKKRDEIMKIKDDFKIKEKYLEDQLKDYKDKLRSLEVDSVKMSNLEEELKNTKLELTILQNKKEEETERLLQRSKDLQDSLDRKCDEYESLQRYVQLFKSSYFNVFGDS